MKYWSAALSLLDLCGSDGRPSFTKLMAVGMLVVSVLVGAFGPAVALVIAAMVFGRTTVLALIGRSSIVASVAESIVLHRRDPHEGVEATP